MIARIAALIALPLASCLVCMSAYSAEVTWRYLPQFLLDRERAPEFMDLDGDGLNEIVMTGNSGAVIGVLGMTEGRLDLVDVFPVRWPKGGYVPMIDGAGSVLGLLLATDDHVKREMHVLSGLPLKRSRAMSFDVPVTPRAWGDIDADGQPEIVEFDNDVWPSTIRALDDATGSVKWMHQVPGTVGGRVVVAQLDGDPALEIVVPGPPGQILDGTTGLPEWQYPNALGPVVYPGQFVSDASIRTFAVRNSQATMVFRSSPWSPLWDYLLPSDLSGPATAWDINNDGIDELVVRSQDGMQFVALNLQGGQEIARWPASYGASSAPGFGTLQPGGELLIVHGSGYLTNQLPSGVEVRAWSGGDVLYSAPTRNGPFGHVVFADVDGDGTEEKVVLTFRGNLPTSPASYEIEVFDSVGGLVVSRHFPDLLANPQSVRAGILSVADVDGQPGTELVLTAFRDHQSLITVLDGVTLETRWEVLAGSGSPLANMRGVAVTAADLDHDGLQDPVVLLSGDNGVRLAGLSGVDGQLLWQSINLPGSSQDGAVIVSQLDEDPAAEILVGTSSVLMVFDAGTRLLEWSVNHAVWDLRSVMHWGQGDDCRVAMAGSQMMDIHRCGDSPFTERVILPWRTDFVRNLDGSGEVFIGAAAGRVYLIKRGSNGYFQTVVSGYLGENLAATTAHMVSRPDGQTGEMDVLLGSDAFAVQLRIDTADSMFRDGFDFPSMALISTLE